jgi:hypothetical protein
VCSEGYYAEGDGTCLECGSGGAGVTSGVIVIIILLFCAILVYVVKKYYSSQVMKLEDGGLKFRSRTLRWLWQRKRELQVKVKIMVVTVQVVSAIPSAVGIQPPSTFYNFFGIFSFLSFNYATIIPFGCSIGYDYVDILLATTIGPIVLVALIYIAYEVDCCLQSEGREKGHRAKIWTRYYQYFLYLTYLVLPSVTTVIFRMFPCQNVDGQAEDQYYLRSDLSISCSSERYTTGVAIAGVMIVVYPFGIPAFYYWQLFLHRDLIRHRSLDGKSGSIRDIAAKYGFLYKSYEPRFWYWERVEAIRRIVLTGVVSVLSPSSSTQSVLGMILALMYIGLYGQLKPYEDDKDDYLAFVGQYQIFWTFFGTLIIGNNLLGSKQGNTVSVFIIIGNLMVFFLGAFYELTDYRRELNLGTFEDKLGGFLEYIPFTDWLKKRKYIKERLSSSLEVSTVAIRMAQDDEEQEHHTSQDRLSRSVAFAAKKPSFVAPVAGEHDEDKFKYAKAIFKKTEEMETRDQIEELLRLKEDGLDDKRSQSYAKYAFLKKEALRSDFEATARNLEGHLYRVKERLKEMSLDASARKKSDIEMSPMHDSIDPNLKGI